MNKIEKTRGMNFIPVLVGFFVFIRAILLTEIYDLGIENLYNFKLNIAGENIALIVLYLFFALFAALVVAKLNKRFGNVVFYLTILLVTEPLFFAKQVNCIALFIAIIGLIFLLNGLRDKPIIPNEITLIVFLFVSCVLDENSIFLFVAPALIAYFFDDIENIFKSVKKIVMLILSAISVGAGILINDFLLEKYPELKVMIETYTFADQIYFKHIKYENILLFVFLIPTLLFCGCFFANMFKKNDEKSPAASYTALCLIVCAYVLSIVGFVLGGSDNFYTVNFIVPIALISMLKGKNDETETALKKVNIFIEKHLLVFFSAVILLYVFSMLIFYEDVNNIAAFALAR